MKQLFLVIFILFGSVAKAQFFEKNAIYLSNSGLIGNYFGLSSSLSFIHKENFMVEVGEWAWPKGQWINPQTTAVDYSVPLP